VTNLARRLRSLVAACTLALAATAAAQEFRGTITGTVTDESRAVLPGVTVTVTNVETGVAVATVTNGDPSRPS
jgi:hypothetical protein